MGVSSSSSSSSVNILCVCLDGESEDGYNAVHGLVLPPDGAGPVSRVVPVTGTGSVEAGTVLLHYHASYYVFEWFLQFGE